MDFSDMTAAELKAYAAENNIDLGDAKTKTKILGVLTGVTTEISLAEEPAKNVITGPNKVNPSGKPSTGVHNNEDGIFMSAAADRPVKKTTEIPKVEVEKIAIYSPKNIRWQGVGQVSVGYNVVTKEAAAKWLTRSGVREATPEEVATFYGK